VTIEEHARRLLDRIGVLRHPSDLDLLIFFARHPRSLLASEHLATFLGYSTKEMAASLDLLVDAGLVTRTQSDRHPARMFVFAQHGPDRGWFADLLKVGATREGRLAMLGALQRGAAEHPGADDPPPEDPAAADARPRPFLVGRTRHGAKETKTG
jgi:hypothetical protein